MKGILFKQDMIQAIIDGRKTQTRRVIKPQPDADRLIHACGVYAWELDGAFVGESKCRYRIGETVYIKEVWAYAMNPLPLQKQRIIYRASETDFSHWEEIIIGKWRSPMFLKAEDARLFPVIRGIRAERLQEISDADCLAEGIRPQTPAEAMNWGQKYRSDFCQLWNSINKDYPWESNPFVWVISFKLARNA
jgi:hypothetical protein